MNATKHFVAVVAVVLSFTVAVGPAQGQNGNENVIVTIVDSAAFLDEFVSQEAEIDLEADEPSVQAAANCQFLAVVNAVAASASTGTGLGLVSDNDEILIDDGFFGLQQGREQIVVDNHDRNATATCEQIMGTVRIIDDPVSGWGEVAPHGDAWNSILNGPFGGSETNVVVQVLDTASFLDEVVSNDVDIELDDEGVAQAASNCQMMFAANVFAAATSVATGDSTIASDDTFNFSFGGPGPEPDPPIIAPLQDRNVDVDSHERTATSSCRQSIESFELFIGGEGKFPPES